MELCPLLFLENKAVTFSKKKHYVATSNRRFPRHFPIFVIPTVPFLHLLHHVTHLLVPRFSVGASRIAALVRFWVMRGRAPTLDAYTFNWQLWAVPYITPRPIRSVRPNKSHILFPTSSP